MDEGKNPSPHIYLQSEKGEFIEELDDFIDQMTDELQNGDPTTESATEKLTQLIANTRQLKPTFENDAKVDMYAASISYNDAAWEFYQILREKSYIRKQQGLSTISRSGGGDHHEYNDDYWDIPQRGDYDHEEEAS